MGGTISLLTNPEKFKTVEGMSRIVTRLCFISMILSVVELSIFATAPQINDTSNIIVGVLGCITFLGAILGLVSTIMKLTWGILLFAVYMTVRFGFNVYEVVLNILMLVHDRKHFNQWRFIFFFTVFIRAIWVFLSFRFACMIHQQGKQQQEEQNEITQQNYQFNSDTTPLYATYDSNFKGNYY
eukprot:gb/GECH01000946.1/.p1 GENE.gb/GECH01000946.1/~~gb/GECH01000946.1/.p1  ORF type:complete len:184 (+),score=25.79 gb/GECH01000946.1/:1-552(+)